jgi:hypothetical protein
MPAIENDRLTLDIAHAAKLLGISVGATYRAARAGDIPALHVSGRILVLREPFMRMLGSAERAA